MGAANLEGRRFDPFDDDVRAVPGAIDALLRRYEYRAMVTWLFASGRMFLGRGFP